MALIAKQNEGSNVLNIRLFGFEAVVGIEHLTFPPDQTIKRLKHALSVFADWEYTLPGWNCEHLGRLLATDQPRCYQSSSIWWLCDMTPEGDHKTAQQVFHSYLSMVDPELIR
jgi:hypothetical protein